MQVTLYALVMLFGALVAVIGLVLLFRKQEQSLSRIRIFNQEFQFSAPGLVVFLAGCVLVVLFPVLHISDSEVICLGCSTGDIHRGGLTAEGTEHEPNNSFETANIIKFPTTIKGGMTAEDVDFFKFQVPSSLSGMPRIKVFIEKGFSGSVTAYDENEQALAGDGKAGDEALLLSFSGAPGHYYYLKVSSSAERGEYTLTLKPDAP